MEYINKEDIKAGDYFILEIGDWRDTDDNEHTNGICYGLAACDGLIESEENDEDNCPSQLVIRCDAAICADNEIEYDTELGGAEDIKARYMTEEEKTYFIQKTQR